MITLQEITSDQQRVLESLRYNYEEWGPPLSFEAYVERERQLDVRITGSGLGHRTFALVSEQGMLAACEVLSRPLYYGGGLVAQDHCFASVFVPREHRKKGYAAQLITEVTEQVMDSEDQASLWSDVGDYYARCGYEFPPPETAEPVSAQPWQTSVVCYPKGGTQTDCEWLLPSQLDQVISDQRRLLCRAADNLYHETEGDIEYAVVVPHRGLYDQLQHRGVYTANHLGIKGAIRLGAVTPNGHGWISWAYMFGSKTLFVIGISGTANEIAQLFKAAAVAAEEHEGLTVEMFQSTLVGSEFNFEEVYAALEGSGLHVELKQRSKSLPMSTGRAVWTYPGGYGWY